MRITSSQLCDELRQNKRTIRTDSRLVTEGDIFVALPPAVPGERDKRAAYVKTALEKGAWGVVAPASALKGLSRSQIWGRAVLAVDDVRTQLGKLAAAYYGTEELDFPVIAITGTNGKTTCAYLLEHLYRSKGMPVGVLGTISYRWPGHEEPAPLTTPDCLTLHRSLAAMRDAGVKAAIMEASSHAIHQGRIAGISFSAAAFTNLTQDHLDYHGSMEEYFQAKRLLFASMPAKNKIMAINSDDEFGRRLLDELPGSIGFGIRWPYVDRQYLLGEVMQSSTNGIAFNFHWHRKDHPRVRWGLISPLVGLHNVSNLLTVSSLALNLGFTPKDLDCFSTFMGVPGRLERIPFPKECPMYDTGIFVDYAHTPDALTRVLDTLRAARFRRIITVFGCGGDRDRTKRPLMAQAVAEKSHIAIATSDNPRTEDPEAILDDVMPGLRNAPKAYRVTDRREALELAVSMLQPGDALLVAGKGHEDYQIIGTEKIHFSDQETIKELISCK